MKPRLLFFAALMLITSTCLAADKDVEALLGKMRSAYKAAKSVKMTVETSVNSQVKFKAKTAVSYVAPNKVHSRVTGLPGGAELTAVSDGKQILISGPQGNHSEKFSQQGMLRGMVANLETICFWDWKRQLSTSDGGNMKSSKLTLKKEKWAGKDWIVLDEDASEMGLIVQYYIDPKTNLIMRTVQMNPDRKVIMEFVVKSIKVGEKIDESIFKI